MKFVVFIVLFLFELSVTFLRKEQKRKKKIKICMDQDLRPDFK